ncbi:MAG: hypothetical protein C0502_01155 [Opitutus sp.]|nr:hypothetical protein [Opitutus sp.]
MKNPIHLLRASVLALCALAAAAASHATNGDTARAKFSDPSKPGTFKLSLAWADVRITGTDTGEVIVRSSLERKKDKGEPVDADGFRRLDDDVTFELKEKNNLITLSVSGDQHWFSHGTEFVVEVPRHTHLIIRTQLGGEIAVSKVDGDIDVNSMNGEVTLEDISSSAVVSTMNGEVRANFVKAPAKPVSITSMNGEIDLRLPADTKANLRMRTHNGSIRTNFPEGVLVSKTEKVPGFRGRGLAYSHEAAEAARDIAREVAREARNAQREVRDAVREATRAQRAAHSGKDEDDETPAPPADAAAASAAAPAIAPVAPVPPIPGWGGKSITGTLNGGGIDISLSSMNGTITLRQGK